MKLRPVLFLAVIIIFPIFGCTLLPAFWLVEDGDITVTESYSQVEVENIAGSIILREWDRNYTLVKYRKEANTQYALDNLYPSVSVDGGKLTVLRQSYTKTLDSGSISFDVFVPAGNYHSGLTSTSGSVTVRGMESGDTFDVRTVSGSVDILGSDSLEIHTTSGAVDFMCEDTDSIEIATASGSVTGIARSLANSAGVNVESISGSVDLTFPWDVAGTFTLRSVSGSIDTAYPQATHAGSGFLSLRVTTVSGAIQIKHD